MKDLHKKVLGLLFMDNLDGKTNPDFVKRVREILRSTPWFGPAAMTDDWQVGAAGCGTRAIHCTRLRAGLPCLPLLSYRYFSYSVCVCVCVCVCACVCARVAGD